MRVGRLRRALPPFVLGIGVIAGLLLAVVLLNREEPSVAQASPTASAAASSTPDPSVGEEVSATPTPAASTPSPVPAPTAPAPILPPTTWSQAARIEEPGRAVTVGDMTAWRDGLIAVGTSYEDTGFANFGPRPPREGRIWASTDGTAWQDVTPSDAFAAAGLESVFVAADASAHIIGWVEVDEFGERESRTWSSVDGESWIPTPLEGLPHSFRVDDVAHGPRGYLISGSAPGEYRGQLWFSADGLVWDLVYETAHPPEAEGSGIADIAAGDEGFVALWYESQTAGWAYAVVASADGRVWVDGTAPDQSGAAIVPFGPDWIWVAQFSDTDHDLQDGMTVGLWHSSNGLTWIDHGQATWGTLTPDVAGADACAEFVEQVRTTDAAAFLGMTLTYACSEGAFRTAGGTWMSSDGVTWARLPFGTRATIGGVSAIDGRHVAATYAGTGGAADRGVTFWISDAP